MIAIYFLKSVVKYFSKLPIVSEVMKTTLTYKLKYILLVNVEKRYYTTVVLISLCLVLTASGQSFTDKYGARTLFSDFSGIAKVGDNYLCFGTSGSVINTKSTSRWMRLTM